jgi:dolichol-phosphate mannosyltransferase
MEVLYNEEAHIAGTVRQLAAALNEASITHELLVINDNSKDATEQILQT